MDLKKMSVGEKIKISSKLSLPSNHEDLEKEDVVKMIYLASGWIGEKLNWGSTEKELEKIALKVNDSE
jgi:hypothetical protein